MGASGWSYFVPYQPNLQAALDALRQQEFERGGYYNPFDAAVSSIEELIEVNETEGTHSIIDIDHVSEQPEFGSVSSLTDSQLTSLFETTKPNRTMIEAKVRDFHNLRQRWEGIYIIAYKDDEPDEIFFTGFSGD